MGSFIESQVYEASRSQGRMRQDDECTERSRGALVHSIVIAGPDGTGKSSLADRLVAELPGEVSIEHYWPMRSRGESSSPPVAELPRGLLLSVVKLLVVWILNLVAALLSRVRGTTRIIERGWWDQVVDPGRYRLPVRAAGLAEVMGRFLPKADLVVLLVGDAHLIHRRKGELSPEQIAEQIEGWRRVLPLAARRQVEIDVSAPIERVVSLVRSAVSA